MTDAQRQSTIATSRKIEDAGVILAFVLAGLYGTGEIVVHVVVSLGFRPLTHAPFPWIIVLFFVGCILPKYLGRSTTGQVWIAFATVAARLIPWGRNGGTGRTIPPPPTPTVEVPAKCGNCGNEMTACICPDAAK